MNGNDELKQSLNAIAGGIIEGVDRKLSEASTGV